MMRLCSQPWGRTVALAAAFGTIGPTASAQVPDVLEQCADAATVAVQTAGGRRHGEPLVGFLQEGETTTFATTLREPTCMGFLAMGHTRVRDLDLFLFTDSGISVGQDVTPNASPYVRFCGAAGLTLIVSVSMYKGRGEFRLLRFEDAPPELPDLNRTVGACFATTGGMRRPSADVGQSPEGRSAEESVREITRTLGALGYQQTGSDQVGSLQSRQSANHGIQLTGGRCYAVSAVGDRGVQDLDLLVRFSDGRELARDHGRGPLAMTRFCAPLSSDYVVDVRMFRGSGSYVVRVLSMEEPPGRRPAGLNGYARVTYAELQRRLQAVGMGARPLSWGFLAPGQSLGMPVQLTAGRCYGLGAAAAEELRYGDVDVILLDEEGSLLGWDLGQVGEPLVFHCAERSGTYRLVTRVYGGRGRFMAVFGEDEDDD